MIYRIRLFLKRQNMHIQTKKKNIETSNLKPQTKDIVVSLFFIVECVFKTSGLKIKTSFAPHVRIYSYKS
jgi:hypothetical protein